MNDLQAMKRLHQVFGAVVIDPDDPADLTGPLPAPDSVRAALERDANPPPVYKRRPKRVSPTRAKADDFQGILGNSLDTP
jgi:hypothetical protein